MDASKNNIPIPGLYGIGQGYSLATSDSTVSAEQRPGAKADSVGLYLKQVGNKLLNQIVSKPAKYATPSDFVSHVVGNSFGSPVPTFLPCQSDIALHGQGILNQSAKSSTYNGIRANTTQYPKTQEHRSEKMLNNYQANHAILIGCGPGISNNISMNSQQYDGLGLSCQKQGQRIYSGNQTQARVATGKSNGGRTSMQAHAATAMGGGSPYNYQPLGKQPSSSIHDKYYPQYNLNNSINLNKFDNNICNRQQVHGMYNPQTNLSQYQESALNIQYENQHQSSCPQAIRSAHLGPTGPPSSTVITSQFSGEKKIKYSSKKNTSKKVKSQNAGLAAQTSGGQNSLIGKKLTDIQQHNNALVQRPHKLEYSDHSTSRAMFANQLEQLLEKQGEPRIAKGGAVSSTSAKKTTMMIKKQQKNKHQSAVGSLDGVSAAVRSPDQPLETKNQSIYHLVLQQGINGIPKTKHRVLDIKSDVVPQLKYLDRDQQHREQYQTVDNDEQEELFSLHSNYQAIPHNKLTNRSSSIGLTVPNAEKYLQNIKHNPLNMTTHNGVTPIEMQHTQQVRGKMPRSEVGNSLGTFPGTVGSSTYPVSKTTPIPAGMIGSPIGSLSLANSRPQDQSDQQQSKVPIQIHASNLPAFLNTSNLQNNTSIKRQVTENDQYPQQSIKNQVPSFIQCTQVGTDFSPSDRGLMNGGLLYGQNSPYGQDLKGIDKSERKGLTPTTINQHKPNGGANLNSQINQPMYAPAATAGFPNGVANQLIYTGQHQKPTPIRQRKGLFAQPISQINELKSTNASRIQGERIVEQAIPQVVESPLPRGSGHKVQPKSGNKKKRAAMVGTVTSGTNKGNGITNQNYPLNASSGNSVKTTLNASLTGCNLNEHKNHNKLNSLKIQPTSNLASAHETSGRFESKGICRSATKTTTKNSHNPHAVINLVSSQNPMIHHVLGGEVGNTSASNLRGSSYGGDLMKPMKSVNLTDGQKKQLGKTIKSRGLSGVPGGGYNNGLKVFSHEPINGSSYNHGLGGTSSLSGKASKPIGQTSRKDHYLQFAAITKMNAIQTQNHLL